MIQHPFPPLYDKNSGILILGSFPSVKSRETAFFYGHPQNRFWKVLSRVLEAPLPETIAEKREFLLSHGVALWDVIASCEIRGNTGHRENPADICQWPDRGQTLSQVPGGAALLSLWRLRQGNRPSFHEPCKCCLDTGQTLRCMEYHPRMMLLIFAADVL